MSVYNVSLDELVGKKEPVMSVVIEGKAHDVYALRHTAMAQSLALMQAVANYQQVQLEIDRTNELIKADSRPAYDSNGAIIDQDLVNVSQTRFLANNMRLAIPMRQVIEAVLGLEDGRLAEYSTAVIERLFTDVNERVLAPAMPKAQADEQPEPTVTQAPIPEPVAAEKAVLTTDEAAAIQEAVSTAVTEVVAQKKSKVTAKSDEI